MGYFKAYGHLVKKFHVNVGKDLVIADKETRRISVPLDLEYAYISAQHLMSFLPQEII